MEVKFPTEKDYFICLYQSLLFVRTGFDQVTVVNVRGPAALMPYLKRRWEMTRKRPAAAPAAAAAARNKKYTYSLRVEKKTYGLNVRNLRKKYQFDLKRSHPT